MKKRKEKNPATALDVWAGTVEGDAVLARVLDPTSNVGKATSRSISLPSVIAATILRSRLFPTTQPQMIRFLTLTIFLATLAALCFGCSSIKGGEARHETHGLHVTMSPDGTLTFDNDREAVATTQPSVSTTANTLPQVEGATEGELGGVKFTEMKRTVVANWWGFLIFLGCAVVSYFIGRWVLVIASISLAVLSIFYPAAIQALAIGTLAVVAVVTILHYRKQIAQLVKGSELALNNLPKPMAEQAKVLMETKQDESTKKAVAAVTAPLDAVKGLA